TAQTDSNCCDSKARRKRERETEAVGMYMCAGKGEGARVWTGVVPQTCGSENGTSVSQIPDDVLTGGLSDWSSLSVKERPGDVACFIKTSHAT
ncbi:hypothetical protein KUCAC02_025631, partial [Chaenocephalus aceratus]